MKTLKHLFMLGLFCLISLAANAEVIPNNEIWYTSSDGKMVTPHYSDVFGADILSNTYINGKFVIKFNGNVTLIGKDAFYGCSGLTSVTIPNSVTLVDNRAFFGCSGLTSVTIPNSVTSIGDYAFSGCSGLTSVAIPNSVTSIGQNAFYGCSGLTNVTIGNFVTSIGEYAFDDCDNVKELIYAEGTKTVLRTWLTSITSVTIPNSVTSIGNFAFYDCSGLTSVTIPNSVTSIGESAFAWCSGLTSMTIPNSVTSIGNSAFSGCEGLTNPVYNNTIFAYMPTSYSGSYSIPNGITTIAGGAFSDCTGLTSVTIPNSVTSIGSYAFARCLGLTSVTIPNSVTSIGERAFAWCSGLTSVTIPNSVTSIGERAFAWCSGLTSVTIPNSVTEIGNSAFEGCSKLTSVTIPNSVTLIGNSAFYGCSGLTSVYAEWKYADEIPSIAYSDFPYETCDLYVPSGTIDSYLAKNYWKKFKSIKEGIKVSIEDKDGKDASIVVNKSITLYDNINSISVPKELEDVNITYTRNFEKAGVWQAWYMPFDVAFDDMKDAYDVAQIHGVLLDKDNNAVLAFLKLDDGMVKANTPYVVRPKASGDVVIETTTDLQPTVSKSFDLKSATDIYYLGGVYEKTTTPGNWYALNLDGQFQLMDNGVYLRPFRIYMSIDPREDNPYATSANANAKMDIVVIGDDEPTGINLTPALSQGEGVIYNLNGQRVTSITSGKIYIMNGKKYIAK